MFSLKAAMKAIEKIGNIKDYQKEEDEKIVIKALNLMLDEKVKFNYLEDKDKDKDKDK